MVQAVVLAAGKSTRTYPLTLTRPKPMLKVMNKPLLEHTLDELIFAGISEAIIVVGYRKEMIMGYFGNKYKNLNLNYHDQKEQNGTWPAVYGARELIKDRFVVVYADDLHSGKDIKRCLDNKNSILVTQTKTPELYGIVQIENGLIKRIVEKPKEYVGDLASTGILVFDKSVFRFAPHVDKSESYLTDMVNLLCNEEEVYPVMLNEYWLPTGYPWHLLNANEYFVSRIADSKSMGSTEVFVMQKGKVHIGKGSVIKSFTYIEGNVVIGENCIVGPSAYLRDGTTIGNNCIIGNSVEIKNSIIMDNTKIKHRSGICDSIIGENVNIGAGTEVANYRHDGGEVKSKVGGKLISTGRKKFGVVIGDNAKLGIHTTLYPGRKIWPWMELKPNAEVIDDIMPEKKEETDLMP